MAKRNTKRKSKRRTKRMRGGSYFNVPIRAFYPQNSFEHDPSRDMQTSLIKGGKKHSRKYLKPSRKSGGSYMGFSQLSMTPVQQIAPMTSYKV
jgi:hypothetical protein